MQVESKEVLYNVVRRTVANMTSGIPVLSMFSDNISNYVIKFIDPYVSAFIVDNKLDVDQLGEFAKEEVNSKIEQFKKNYKERNL